MTRTTQLIQEGNAVSEDYKIQASIKFGNNLTGMLNLRANSAQELDVLCREAEEVTAGALAGLTESLTALNTIGQAFPQTQVQQQPPQPQASNNNGQVPVCQHGPRVFKSGADWQGWFCPAPKNDPSKCKAQYIR